MCTQQTQPSGYTAGDETMNYRLSPSDLTFLYEGCKHCFVLKVKHGIVQPSIPLPAIFSTIALLQKDLYANARTESICAGPPPGVVRHGEQQVRSRPLAFAGCTSGCVISGRFDIVAELDDRSYGVFDFKTGKPTDEKGLMYGRQLHAYAVALEQPAEGALALAPVTSLGLLYFTPDRCARTEPPRQVLEGDMRWQPVRRDDGTFLAFLEEVVRLLDGPMPPMEPDRCDWCAYRTQTVGMGGQGGLQTAPTHADLSAPACPACNGPMRRRSGKYGEFWSCMNYPACKGTRNVSGSS
jgi:hypothetical protein